MKAYWQAKANGKPHPLNGNDRNYTPGDITGLHSIVRQVRGLALHLDVNRIIPQPVYVAVFNGIQCC